MKSKVENVTPGDLVCGLVLTLFLAGALASLL